MFYVSKILWDTNFIFITSFNPIFTYARINNLKPGPIKRSGGRGDGSWTKRQQARTIIFIQNALGKWRFFVISWQKFWPLQHLALSFAPGELLKMYFLESRKFNTLIIFKAIFFISIVTFFKLNIFITIKRWSIMYHISVQRRAPINGFLLSCITFELSSSRDSLNEAFTVDLPAIIVWDSSSNPEPNKQSFYNWSWLKHWICYPGSHPL